MKVFTPDEEGMLLGDRAVVVYSEVEGNPGAGVTEAAEDIHAEVTAAFGLSDPVWIEHHPPATTDGSTETVELVVFSAFGKPSWKPLDRRSVEAILGRRL